MSSGTLQRGEEHAGKVRRVQMGFGTSKMAGCYVCMYACTYIHTYIHTYITTSHFRCPKSIQVCQITDFDGPSTICTFHLEVHIIKILYDHLEGMSANVIMMCHNEGRPIVINGSTLNTNYIIWHVFISR